MKSSIVQTQSIRGAITRMASMALLVALPTAAPFHSALAAVAPSLGTAQSFAVLGASTVTNTGPTVVTGNLGVSPGTAVTGFPPGIVVGGTIHAADAVASQAQADTTTAYNALASQACDTTFGVPTDIGGQTLVPGVYCFASSAQITGQLTLDAGGNPNAVWVFKVGSTLITASNASVLLINGAQACNVFWQVGSSATIGTGTSFIGNILALASVTLTTDATVSGRALARNGAVTMDSNLVTASSCAIPPVTPLPPTIGKAFSPATINAGGNSTLTITLSNPDATVATLTSPFTDTLPSGVTIAGVPTTTCGGAVSVGASSVTLTGGSIPANGSCTVSVPVTAAAGGNYIDSIAAGALQTSNGGNANPAVATLTVVPATVPPTIGKAFSPATINAGGNSTLTITLSNANAAAATLSAPFTDTLPSGVTISAAPTTTCGGAISFSASSVTMTGGSIPANGSCTITVPVTAPTGGNFINTVAAGALQTSNGNNVAPAVATLTVLTPNVAPTVGKAFSPATINAGGNSTLTITLSNTNPTAAILSAPFTDTLPAGLTISAAPTTTCGGVISFSTTSVTMTGGSIPANGSCTITVPVFAATGGNFINTVAAGALQTSNGNNAAPAIATLTVVADVIPPTVGKAFNPASITAGGSSTLTITLSNANSTPANLTAPFTETLPSGLVISGTPTTSCSGVISSNSQSVTLTGGAIPANGSCTITVHVIAAVAGNYVNSIAAGDLQTDHGNNPAPAIATLTVVPVIKAPSIHKSFSPSTIKEGGESTLTITLTNPNSAIANLTAPFTDTLPAGVVAINGTASNTCGGLVTVTPSTVTLTGGSIPANGSCSVKVKVTANAKGKYVDLIPAGALQTDQGSNALPAKAILIVKRSGSGE